MVARKGGGERWEAVVNGHEVLGVTDSSVNGDGCETLNILKPTVCVFNGGANVV